MVDKIAVRNSYGIICVRRIGTRPRYQVLMVKKRFTYAFMLFVTGQYTRGNFAYLGTLLNKMTMEEKLLLLSNDYSLIARQIWIPSNNRYFAWMNQYQDTMAAFNGKFSKMIKASKTHGHLRWEVPKGKKNDSSETDIQAALREFTEETGMKKESFVLMPDITRTDSYEDDNKRYVTKYFVGYGTYEPSLGHLGDNEIADVKWMDLAEVAVADSLGNAHMRQIVRPAINVVKKALRNGTLV